jgi:hypothetical protein
LPGERGEAALPVCNLLLAGSEKLFPALERLLAVGEVKLAGRLLGARIQLRFSTAAEREAPVCELPLELHLEHLELALALRGLRGSASQLRLRARDLGGRLGPDPLALGAQVVLPLREPLALALKLAGFDRIGHGPMIRPLSV